MTEDPPPTHENVQKAQLEVLRDRWTCEHPLATEKTFRCPGCRGIMRRCCQTVLSTHHEESCKDR